MQAWGNYGTAWPVVHQWLGVRPDLGRSFLEVVPQVPQGQTTVRGRHIHLGHGFADVAATHVGDTYRTRIAVGSGVGAAKVAIGHTLPAGSHPTAVLLDGHAVQDFRVRVSNRGVEVTVVTSAGHHTLTVMA
jgi:hypothetical protein